MALAPGSPWAPLATPGNAGCLPRGQWPWEGGPCPSAALGPTEGARDIWKNNDLEIIVNNEKMADYLDMRIRAFLRDSYRGGNTASLS